MIDLFLIIAVKVLITKLEADVKSVHSTKRGLEACGCSVAPVLDSVLLWLASGSGCCAVPVAVPFGLVFGSDCRVVPVSIWFGLACGSGWRAGLVAAQFGLPPGSG